MKRLINLRSQLIIKILMTAFIVSSSLFVYPGCGKNDYSTNSSNNSGTPGTNEIFLQGMSFSPANMTVSAGTTVTWTNHDSYAHTVTSGTPGSPTGVFDSGSMGTNAAFSYKFGQTGTFKYYCKFHSSMSGTITVK